MPDKDYDESEIRLIFNSYDSYDTGYLGMTEFVKLARALNSRITEEGIKKGFRRFDKNGDGRISFDEFIDWRNER